MKQVVNRGIAWSGVAQAIISLSDMLSIMVTLALFANEKDYGVASMALWLFPILDTVTDLGVANAVIQRDDHSDDKIATVFWVNMLIGGALALLLIGFAPLYASLQGHSIVAMLLIAYSSKLLIQNAYTIPVALMRKELRFDEVAKLRIVAHVTESVARPFFAWLGMPIWCFVLAPLLRTITFAFMVQLRRRFVPKLVFKFAEIKAYLHFGLRSGATQLLYQTYSNLDYPIVGFVFGPAALGAYKLAYEIILEPVRSITNVVSDVALPTFAKLKDHELGRVAQFVSFTRLNIMAVMPFLVLLFIGIPDIVMVFAKAQSAVSLQLTADCVRILCIVGVLRALGFIGPPVLDGLGYPGLSLRYMTFAALAMPLCFINGAYYFGDAHSAASVAMAWAAGYPVAFVLLMRLVMRKLPIALWPYLKVALPPAAVALAGLVVGLGARALLINADRSVRLGVAMTVASVVMLLGYRFVMGITLRSIRGSMRDP